MVTKPRFNLGFTPLEAEDFTICHRDKYKGGLMKIKLNNGSSRFLTGFTQIELLVVIGIIVILGSMGAIIGFDSISRSAVYSERDLLVTLLSSARAKALANVNASPHGLFVDTDSFVLFEGDSYATSDSASHREVNRSSSIAVTGLTETVFEQLSGNVLTPGIFILTGVNGSTEVDINSQGRIDW